MNRIFIRIFVLFCAFELVSVSSVWAAGEIDQLKSEVQYLKGNVENTNAQLAEALNRLAQMQQEFASVRGALESSNHYAEEQTRALREYDQRISALEDKISILMNLLKEVRDGSASPKTLAADEVQTREFQRLLDLINAEDYNKALAGFQAFAQKYPKSPLSDSVQYWTAECFYSLNDLKKAIGEYQVLIQKFPASPKVKQALLKQGYAFFGLRMYPEARPFLEKVVASYPNTLESSKALAKLKEIDRIQATLPPESAPGVAPTPPSSPTFPPVSSVNPISPSPSASTIAPAPAPARSSAPTQTTPRKPVSGGMYD